jgi:hypothetical protein
MKGEWDEMGIAYTYLGGSRKFIRKFSQTA